MKHYRHILVAVDLTDNSAALVARAQDIQALSQAKLTLVHVIDYAPMIYAGGEFALPVDIDTFDDSISKASQAKLLELAHHCKVNEADCQLLHGEKENELVQLAENLNIDLLVVGAHDKQGFSRLFSSTADSLLHALPCDILNVKQEPID